MITNSNREKIEDKIISQDIGTEEKFHNKLFVRVGAKDIKFTKVDFSHTYFEHVYFRNCVFDSCNFNGCKFINSNFVGSSFPGSRFDYASFHNSNFEDEILEVNCPGYDNQKLKFARSLRLNFQSLGDAEAVNKAINIELDAKYSHLKKTWKSNESYYRKKYPGIKRITAYFKWLWFTIQGFVWGHGENIWKLLRFIVLILLTMLLIDFILIKESLAFYSIINSFIRVPSIFMGVFNPSSYPIYYLSFLFGLRLLIFGLFLSILIKRFNKR